MTASVGVVYQGSNVSTVWDGATIHCNSSEIELRYVPSSGRFYTNHSPENGFNVPQLETGQATLGQTELNGQFPVGSIDSLGTGTGYLQFDLQVVKSQP